MADEHITARTQTPNGAFHHDVHWANRRGAVDPYPQGLNPPAAPPTFSPEQIEQIIEALKPVVRTVVVSTLETVTALPAAPPKPEAPAVTTIVAADKPAS